MKEGTSALSLRHTEKKRREETGGSHRQTIQIDAALTAKVRALGVEYTQGDLEEAFWAHHRPVDVLGLDTALLFEVKYP